MKYASGGVGGKTGEALELEVPVKGVKPEPEPKAAPKQKTGADPNGGGASQDPQPAGPVVKEEGDDVIVDPPVRNLPQWDERWGKTRMAGSKTGMMFDWQENGCNASTAAMILRWFAEDCPAGKLPFPTKQGGAIQQSWYSPRMAEAYWPNADPPGKVSLSGSGRIDFPWIYAVCTNYLTSGGDLPRAENGDVAHPSKKAYTVENEPKEGWLPTLRKMLKTGPVIVGLGAPAGHFVLAHAVVGGAVALVDPGNVLCTAKNGGKGPIQNWQSKSGYLDAGKDLANADKVRMPKATQWPDGSAPGNEGDYRAYNLVSGEFLKSIFDNLHSLTSLTYPDGAKFDGAPAKTDPKPKAQEPAKPPSDAETASSGEKAAEALAIKNEPNLQPLQDQYRAALAKSANTLTKDDACVILAFLHHAGFIQLLGSPFSSKSIKPPSISGSSLAWPKAGDRVGFGCWIKFKEGGEELPQPGASKVGPIEGHFGFIYNAMNSKWASDRAVIKDKTAQIGNVDPRSAVALYRSANWMQENYGVTECYHAGVNGVAPEVRNDCHGQGRALDFSGLVGTMSGQSYEWFVLADWGMQPVPEGRAGETAHDWPYKPGVTTYRMAHRLDEAQPSPARFFWDFYKFAGTQWHAGGLPELPRSFDKPIDIDGFLYHPDTFASNKGAKSGREAHQNHMHIQIGVTGTEK